jgi:hypothetical protein
MENRGAEATEGIPADEQISTSKRPSGPPGIALAITSMRRSQMEANTISLERSNAGFGAMGLFTPCPRCGREALMFIEHDLTVYEHRPSVADETREVCIVA